MGQAGRAFLVSAAAVVVLLLQGCLLAEGTLSYARVSVQAAEDMADNAHCLSQAAYSVKTKISYVS